MKSTIIRSIRKNFNKLFTGASPNFALWLLFLLGILILLLLPILLTRPVFCEVFDFSNTGQIGDTIGGITTPFIALIGVFLTFLAFWIQYKANIEQTKQFKTQDISNKKERFETKFYDLIKLHRENIIEFNIQDNVIGRKCFIYMFSELRFCYCLLDKLYLIHLKTHKTKFKLSKDQIFNISYLTFFFGIGNISDIAYKDLMKQFDEILITDYHTKLKEWQQAYSDKISKILIPHENGGVCEMKLKYKPFEGHVSRLGHYFRHLFLTIKFVTEQDEDVIPNKYHYIKTLRAQLSSHEQLLIYYNSLSILGKPWNDDNLISDYSFIKSIPLPYADFFQKPKDKFSVKNKFGKKQFEWDEIMERMNAL